MRIADTAESNGFRQSTTELIGPRLGQLTQIAIGMAVTGGVLTGIGAATFGTGVFHSYLFAYMFWIGVTCGSLGLLMLHHTVGGGWGFVIRRFMEAGSSPVMFGVMLVLFLPILATAFGVVPALYSQEWQGLHGTEHGWAHPASADDPVIQAKRIWLNPVGFAVRAVLYFLVWMWFAWRLQALGRTQDERADAGVTERLNRLGAFGMLCFALTITFMSVDWVMSLTPHWFSSIFGLLFVAGQALSTLSLMVFLLWRLAGDKPLVRGIPEGYFRDLGNLTLAIVMLWAYMSFSQYLIVYSGNTQHEIPWYIQRNRNGWSVIPVILMAFHFLFPFLFLLVASRVKKDPTRLGKVALYLVVMRFIDLFWLVTPTFRESLWTPQAIPSDIGAPLLIGGIWLLVWTSQVRDRPVVPLHDPRFEQHLKEAHAHG